MVEKISKIYDFAKFAKVYLGHLIHGEDSVIEHADRLENLCETFPKVEEFLPTAIKFELFDYITTFLPSYYQRNINEVLISEGYRQELEILEAKIKMANQLLFPISVEKRQISLRGLIKK